MKRNKKFSILCLITSAFVALFSATAGIAAVDVSITGTVYADEWDDKDNVIAVVIETADGDVYNVSAHGKGKDLLKLVDKNVRATGTVEETDGEKIITVMAYEVTE